MLSVNLVSFHPFQIINTRGKKIGLRGGLRLTERLLKHLDFWYGLFNIILPTAEFSSLESYPSWAFIPLIYYHSRRANCFSAPLGTCAGNQAAREGPLFNFLSNKFPPFFFLSSFESTGKLEFIEFRHVH